MNPPCNCTDPSTCEGCPERTIHYIHRRSDFTQDIFIGGVWVASAKTWHAADTVELAHCPDEDTDPLLCATCDGEGRIPAGGWGDQAGGWAETCPDCDGRPRHVSFDELPPFVPFHSVPLGANS